MRNGGYRIVNLKGTVLTSGTATKIVGAYEAANNPHGKPTLVSGLVVGDTVYPDFFVVFTNTSGTMYGVTRVNDHPVSFTIASNDNVTVLD